MKMRFDKETKELKIKDNLKMNFMLLNLLMIINIINALLTFYNNYLAGIKTNWILIFLGLVSLFILLFSFTRSTQEVIPLDEIDYLIEQRVFGRKRFSLKLRNGKTRNLPMKKDNIPEFERMIDEMNIDKSPKMI